jgi:hypothetical protein
VEKNEDMMLEPTPDMNIYTEDDIFGYMETSFSWEFDPTIITELTQKSSSVVRLKVLSVGEGLFLESSEEFYNPYMPYTPVQIRIVDVLSGDELADEMTIYIQGGNVLISDIIEATPERANKMGLDSIGLSERTSKYIAYVSESDYRFQVGQEYVCILTKQSKEIYTVMASGYGVFKAEDNASSTRIKSSEFKNVLTNQAFD